MDTLFSDLRYAFRTLIKAPAFTAVAVLTLTIGIGANTAIFSVVDAVLLQPLPYRQPEQLVAITTHATSNPADRNPTSLPDLMDYRAQNTTFTSVAAVAFNRYELNGPEGTDFARAAMGTPDLFALLGSSPLIGRTPTADDERAAVVVLSHRLWVQRYHGDTAALGKTVKLYDVPYTIIGVMPAGFHYPTPDIDLWLSLYPIHTSPGNPNWITTRGLHGFRAVGRLKPGVTIAAAEADLNAVQQRLAATYRDDAGTGITLVPVSESTVAGVARALWMLLGAAGFVLLIACANIAHLLLARTTARAREIAVRQAMGATRRRLARQLITESVLLGVVGGAGGVLVAVWGTALLVKLSPGDIPRLETVAVNGWVLLFAGVVSMLAGLVFGVAPAVQAGRSEFGTVLGNDARGVGARARGAHVRSWLMAVETAVALVLLMATGLMLQSFARLVRTDPGFPSARLLTFHMTLPSPSPAAQASLTDRAMARLAALPGITAVGAATSLPPTYTQQSGGFTIDGDPPPAPGAGPTALFVPATPGYLKALGPAWVSGRNFDERDDANSSPVLIVSRSFAKRYFPGRDPLERTISFGTVPVRIIGIVEDMHFFGLREPAGPTMYVPFSQSPFGGVWVAARTSGDPTSLAQSIRVALHEVDPGLNARGIMTMDEQLSDSVVQPRFQTSLLSIFGAIALLLAAVGIYGVINYGVAQRVGEIGVRLALGASRRTVLAMIVKQGMAPVLAGIAAGLVGSFALTRLLKTLLYQVAPTDPATLIAVTLVLGGVALAAALVPARRAATVDPMIALRHD